MLSISFDRGYLESLNNLEGVEQKRVNQSITRFIDDPEHPGLNFEQLQGKRQRRLYTIRGSQELRILIAREGDTYVVLYAGHHDDVYELAARKYFVVGQQAEHIGLFDLGDGEQPVAQQPTPASTAQEQLAGVVDHWTDAELLDVGFEPGQVAALRALKDPNNLLVHLPGLSDEQFDLFWEIVEQTPAQYYQPVLAEPDERLYRALSKFGGWGNLSQLLSPAEVEELGSRPIEAWMVFLHPEQRSLVEKNFSGPARVRGSAGTGKTVVALHRAAHLAAQIREEVDPKPVLFTTFVKSLPPVFESLYLRLPGSVAGEVEFTHIDKIAREVCSRVDDHVSTLPQAINTSFSKAYKSIVVSGSPLSKAGFTRGYLREEITAVVKGRAIRTRDEYLEIERTGRRVPMTRDQRSQLWALREAWDSEMADRGTIDFCDVVIRARDHARRASSSHYSAVVVDESQDLTLAGLQMIRSLVNGSSGDVENGLFLVGDGAQRIYPGGYTLRQAGIEVRGRTTLLKANYRNTAEIIGAAMHVAGEEHIDDLGESFKRGEAPAEAGRSGSRPRLIECVDLAAQLSEIAEQVLEAVDSEQVGLGDIGVLTPTNKLADAVASRLSEAGLSTQLLEKYNGRPNELLKCGTYHRAKGLEFKRVFLPGLSSDMFPRSIAGNEDSTEVAEHRALAISQLFVAMTRARDSLAILYSGEPSEVLQSGLEHFELIDRT